MRDNVKPRSDTDIAACCCVEIGTVIDNSDCTAHWSGAFPDRTAAEAMLTQLGQRAQQAASEPCTIHATFTDRGAALQLDIDFTFCCQAESLIFQLGLR